MSLRLIGIGLTCCFLVLAACTPATATLPTDAATLAAGYTLTTTTGIEDVDTVLAAVASDDMDKLRSVIRYTSAPCTNAEGLGGPPKCRDGEAEGTVSEVLPFLGSEGSFIRKDEIANWKGMEATGLYAVYRVAENEQAEEYYPHGEYAVILKTSTGSAISLRIANGGIVRIDDLLNVTQNSLETLMKQDAAEVILAPQVR